MPLTNTTHITAFTRPPPDAVTFAFLPRNDRPSETSQQIPPTSVTFYPGSTLTTALHWHVTHTEYLRVLSGAALITVSGKSMVYTATDGLAEVPRYARHEWMRFDRPAALLSQRQREVQEAWMREQGEDAVEKYRGMDLVAEEWTDPADGEKEVFFRNLFSVTSETKYKKSWFWGLWTALTVMCVMWELDNYLVLVDFGGWKGGWRERVERWVSYAVMGAAAFLGGVVGCRAVDEEYTPVHLRDAWRDRKRKVV